MYKMYNYFRQYNDNKEILDQKKFYRKFSNEREFGGAYKGIDHLVYSRFFDTFGHVINGILRCRPKRMIDIGCGNGVNLPLSKLFPEIEYYAVEYAEKTLRTAFEDYPDVYFHCCDAFQTSFKDKSFDFPTCFVCAQIGGKHKKSNLQLSAASDNAKNLAVSSFNHKQSDSPIKFTPQSVLFWVGVGNVCCVSTFLTTCIV